MITSPLLFLVFSALCSATVDKVGVPPSTRKTLTLSRVVKFEHTIYGRSFQGCLNDLQDPLVWDEELQRWKGFMKLVLGEKSFDDNHKMMSLIQQFAGELGLVEYPTGANQNAVTRIIHRHNPKSISELRLCELLITERESLLKLKSCNALKGLPIELVAGVAIKIALGLYEGEKLANEKIKELLLKFARLCGVPQIVVVSNNLNPDTSIGEVLKLYDDFLLHKNERSDVFAEALFTATLNVPELRAAKEVYEKQDNAWFSVGSHLLLLFDQEFTKRHGFSEELVDKIMQGVESAINLFYLVRLLGQYLSHNENVPERWIKAIKFRLAEGDELDLTGATWLHIVAPESFKCPDGAITDMETCLFIALGLKSPFLFPPDKFIAARKSFLDKSVIPDAASLLLNQDLSRGEFLHGLSLICEGKKFDLSGSLHFEDRLVLLVYLASTFGTKYWSKCDRFCTFVYDKLLMLSALLEYVKSDFGRVDELQAHHDLLTGMYLLTPNPDLAHEILKRLPATIEIPDLSEPSVLTAEVLEQASKRIRFYMSPIDGSL